MYWLKDGDGNDFQGYDLISSVHFDWTRVWPRMLALRTARLHEPIQTVGTYLRAVVLGHVRCTQWGAFIRTMGYGPLQFNHLQPGYRELVQTMTIC